MKEKLKIFMEHFICLFVVYAIMFEKHYATDSYYYDHFFHIDPLIYGAGNISLGRYGAYFLNKITSAIHLNCVEQQFWVVLILIISLSISVSVIWYRYKKWYTDSKFERDVLMRLSIILLFCNVFVLEWFIFVEMDIVWSLAILFMTLAVTKIDRKISLINLFIIYLLESFSLSFYQATLGYFITLGLVVCLIEYKCELNKNSFLIMIKVILTGVLASATNILYIRSVQWMGIAPTRDRTEPISLAVIIQNLKNIFFALKKWFFNANELLPNYSVLIILITTYIIFIAWNIICKNNLKKFIFYSFIIIISFGSVIAPHIMTSSLWMTQRTIVCFFNIISLPWMVLALNSEKKDIFYKSGTLIMLCFLMVNVVKIQSISANVIATNRIDSEISFSIQHMIEKYQEESGITVKNVCIVKDAYVKPGYQSTDYTTVYDTNRKAFSVDWSSVNCLNYYNGTNYIQVEPDYELLTELMSGNWEALDLSEQMIYDGETVYIVTY